MYNSYFAHTCLLLKGLHTIATFGQMPCDPTSYLNLLIYLVFSVLNFSLENICLWLQRNLVLSEGNGWRTTSEHRLWNRPETASAEWAVSENYLIIPGHMVCFILIVASWLHLLKLIQSHGPAELRFLCSSWAAVCTYHSLWNDFFMPFL